MFASKIVEKIDSFQELVNQGLGQQSLRPANKDQVFKVILVFSRALCRTNVRLTPAQSLILSHAEKLLYRDNGGPRTSPQLDVPNAVEVLDFKSGTNPGPTASRLRIDAASGPDSAWNLRACQVFAQSFRAMRHPEAEGRTFMDASHEFYRLIPTFTSRHAVGSGFAERRDFERFQGFAMKHIRRHRVILSSAIPNLFAE